MNCPFGRSTQPHGEAGVSRSSWTSQEPWEMSTWDLNASGPRSWEAGCSWPGEEGQFLGNSRLVTPSALFPSVWVLAWVHWTSLVAQTVKHLSTMRETQVPSLGWEDPLEKEMAINSSTITWKIPWTEEPVRLQSMGPQRVGDYWATSRSHFHSYLLLWT